MLWILAYELSWLLHRDMHCKTWAHPEWSPLVVQVRASMKAPGNVHHCWKGATLKTYTSHEYCWVMCMIWSCKLHHFWLGVKGHPHHSYLNYQSHNRHTCMLCKVTHVHLLCTARIKLCTTKQFLEAHSNSNVKGMCSLSRTAANYSWQTMHASKRHGILVFWHQTVVDVAHKWIPSGNARLPKLQGSKTKSASRSLKCSITSAHDLILLDRPIIRSLTWRPTQYRPPHMRVLVALHSHVSCRCDLNMPQETVYMFTSSTMLNKHLTLHHQW